MVISADIYRLTQEFFEYEPLGEHELRGVVRPMAIYRVLGDTGAQSRLEIAGTRELTPLVGRESEYTLLFERWEQAKDGHGQVVLLSARASTARRRDLAHEVRRWQKAWKVRAKRAAR